LPRTGRQVDLNGSSRCLIATYSLKSWSTYHNFIDIYFYDPQSSWQRGSNENTNRLLRQYFPKWTDLSVHSQATLNKVAGELNERPSETLNFETPAQRFNACVASTS
jgi:IS30 family transposase